LYLLFSFNKLKLCDIYNFILAVSNPIEVITCLATQNKITKCYPSLFHQHNERIKYIIQYKLLISIFLVNKEKIILIVTIIFGLLGLVTILIGILSLIFTNQIFLFLCYVIIMVYLTISISVFF
jgi:hypothetical protein